MIVEVLLVPFLFAATPVVGTIWVMQHDEQCRFDLEDARIMHNLGRFAAGT